MPTPRQVLLPPQSRARAMPITAVGRAGWRRLRTKLPRAARAWAAAAGFDGDAGRHLVVPGADGRIRQVIYGLAEGSMADPFAMGRLARMLPSGTYMLEGDGLDLRLAALGWVLEAYSFDPYRQAAPAPARLVCPAGVDYEALLGEAEAAYLTRDLVNTPASDMGPDELEAAARKVADEFGAVVKVVSGAHLAREFPLIHHVGKASSRSPRLIDFTWGEVRAPKVTLVGKGVCFDTGGLDIKPAAGMATMKKDMGGAATVLGLARMIMRARLPVRLRVLVPAVENAIAGNAFRPGDVLTSRKGLTVEIGNTDAEGRLILADALALADEEGPDLLVDMATLTGAARVALGPDLPPYYTDDESLAHALADAARRDNDPLWRLPLWQPYLRLFESSVASLNNSSDSGFAGSITAALFLKQFVAQARAYVHFDIFAWTPQSRPGRPKGGEAQGQRALFTVIRDRFAP
jgi:leucyl aminopeptidase